MQEEKSKNPRAFTTTLDEVAKKSLQSTLNAFNSVSREMYIFLEKRHNDTNYSGNRSMSKAIFVVSTEGIEETLSLATTSTADSHPEIQVAHRLYNDDEFAKKYFFCSIYKHESLFELKYIFLQMVKTGHNHQTKKNHLPFRIRWEDDQ
jgi:hypothetical protein